MYHVTRTKSGQFQVVLLGKNGKVLSTSELFPRKQNAIGNIKAQAKALDTLIDFQDDTIKNPLAKRMDHTGKIWGTFYEADNKYIPGKNPSLKKKKK